MTGRLVFGTVTEGRPRGICLRIERSGTPTVKLCASLNFRGINLEGGCCRRPMRGTVLVALDVRARK